MATTASIYEKLVQNIHVTKAAANFSFQYTNTGCAIVNNIRNSNITARYNSQQTQLIVENVPYAPSRDNSIFVIFSYRLAKEYDIQDRILHIDSKHFTEYNVDRGRMILKYDDNDGHMISLRKADVLTSYYRVILPIASARDSQNASLDYDSDVYQSYSYFSDKLADPLLTGIFGTGPAWTNPEGQNSNFFTHGSRLTSFTLSVLPSTTRKIYFESLYISLDYLNVTPSYYKEWNTLRYIMTHVPVSIKEYSNIAGGSLPLLNSGEEIISRSGMYDRQFDRVLSTKYPYTFNIGGTGHTNHDFIFHYAISGCETIPSIENCLGKDTTYVSYLKPLEGTIYTLKLYDKYRYTYTLKCGQDIVFRLTTDVHIVRDIHSDNWSQQKKQYFLDSGKHYGHLRTLKFFVSGKYRTSGEDYESTLKLETSKQLGYISISEIGEAYFENTYKYDYIYSVGFSVNAVIIYDHMLKKITVLNPNNLEPFTSPKRVNDQLFQVNNVSSLGDSNLAFTIACENVQVNDDEVLDSEESDLINILKDKNTLDDVHSRTMVCPYLNFSQGKRYYESKGLVCGMITENSCNVRATLLNDYRDEDAIEEPILYFATNVDSTPISTKNISDQSWNSFTFVVYHNNINYSPTVQLPDGIVKISNNASTISDTYTIRINNAGKKTIIAEYAEVAGVSTYKKASLELTCFTASNIVFYVDSSTSQSTSTTASVHDTFVLHVNTTSNDQPQISGTGTTKVQLSDHTVSTSTTKKNLYVHSYTAEVKGSGNWSLTFSYASNTSRTATTATFTVQASKKNISMLMYSDDKTFWDKDRIEGNYPYNGRRTLTATSRVVGEDFYLICNTNYPSGPPTVYGQGSSKFQTVGNSSSCTKTTISTFSNLLNTDGVDFAYDFFYIWKLQTKVAGTFEVDFRYAGDSAWNSYDYNPVDESDSSTTISGITLTGIKRQQNLEFNNGATRATQLIIDTNGARPLGINDTLTFRLNSTESTVPNRVGDSNSTVKIGNPISSTTTTSTSTYLYKYLYDFPATVKGAGDHTIKFYYSSSTAVSGATATAIVSARRYTPTMAAYFNGSSTPATSYPNATAGSVFTCTIQSSEDLRPDAVTGTSSTTITCAFNSSSNKRHYYTLTPVSAGLYNIMFKYNISGNRDSATLTIPVTVAARPTNLTVYFRTTEGSTVTKTEITRSSNTKTCQIGDVFYLAVDGENTRPEVTTPSTSIAICQYDSSLSSGNSYVYSVTATGLCSSSDNVTIKFSYDSDNGKRQATERSLKLVINKKQGEIKFYGDSNYNTQISDHTMTVSGSFNLYVATGETDAPTLTFESSAISTGTSVTNIATGIYQYTIVPKKSGDHTITFSYSDQSGTRDIPSKNFTIHTNVITPVLEIYDESDASRLSTDSNTYTTPTHKDTPNNTFPILVKGMANRKPTTTVSDPAHLIKMENTTRSVASSGMFWYNLTANQSGNFQFTARYDSTTTQASATRTISLVIDARVSTMVLKYKGPDDSVFSNLGDRNITCFTNQQIKIMAETNDPEQPTTVTDEPLSSLNINYKGHTRSGSVHQHNYEFTPLTPGHKGVSLVYTSTTSRTSSTGIIHITGRPLQQINTFEDIYTYNQESTNFTRDKTHLSNPTSSPSTAKSLTMSRGESRYFYYEETNRLEIKPTVTHYPAADTNSVTIDSNINSSTYVTLQGFPSSIPEHTSVYKITANRTFSNHTIKAVFPANEYYYANEDFFLLSSEERTTPNITFSTSTTIANTCTGISIVEGRSFNLFVASNVDRKPDRIENTSLLGYSYSSANSFKSGSRHVWCYAVTAPEGSSDATMTFSYFNKLHGGTFTPNHDETRTFTLSVLPDKTATTVEIRKDTATSVKITSSTTVEVLTEFKLIISSNRTDVPEVSNSNFVIDHERSIGKVHYFTCMANTVNTEGYTVTVTYPESDEQKKLALTTSIVVIVKQQKVQPTLRFSSAAAPSTYRSSFTINFGESFSFLVTSNMSTKPTYYSRSTATLTEGTTTGTVFAYTFPMSPAGSYVLKFGYAGNDSVKEYYSTILIRVRGEDTNAWREDGGAGSVPFDAYIGEGGGGSAALVMQRDSDRIWHTTTIIDGEGNQISTDFPSVNITSSAKTALATFVSGLPISSGTTVSGS